MSDSPDPRPGSSALTRRRLLRGAALGSAVLAGASATAACTDGDALTPEDLMDADPMDMEPIAITGVRSPGDAGRFAITVRGRRILAVGDPVDGARKLDMADGVVVPGFIDSHVHMQFATTEAVLAGGVTSVRDLGGPPTGAQALLGRTPLKVLIAGRILTPPGGYPTQSWGADGTGREVQDPDDAELAVDEQASAGATTIKIALEDSQDRPLFDVATIQRITRVAADRGLRTTAHVGSSLALDRALEGGVRELCHLPLHDVSVPEMVRVAEAGVVVVPTLGIHSASSQALAALSAFRSDGGDILYGSDLGNEGTSPGISVEEVRLMQQVGMRPGEVLASATSDAAAYHGLDTGQLVAERVADLVVLGGDPFEDPRAYADVRLVVASGEVVGP